jgi:Tfp pilus assembly protein PilF
MLSRLFRAMRGAFAQRNPADVADAGLADAHFSAGRFDEARPLYEMLRTRNPGDAETLFRLGVIYGRSGLLHEAGEVLALAARARPHSVDVLNAQANVAWLQSEWSRSEQLFRAALEVAPRNATLLANFGLCLHDAGKLDAADEALGRALEIEPAHADALVNAALVRLDLGDAAGAQALILRALAVAPEFAEAHALYAQLLLRQGHYADGWREYEYRLRCRDAHYAENPQLPRWNGTADSSRTLMIYAEQGLGDQIMFASCLPDVLTRVSRCEVECDPRLVKLFARSFPAAQFHAQRPGLERPWAAAPHAASQIQFGSLPQLFRNDGNQFPVRGGYLQPAADRAAFWRAQLAELGDGLNVGIAWRGGVPRTRQALRSIALTEWLPLLRTPGVNFISLQHGACDDDYRAVAAQGEVRIPHWQSAIDDCDETAALISALDVVICVCGSLVHLAGAVGKTAWVMVPACPEWRYSGAGDRMPWYPSVRLFRQTTLGDWRGPMAEIAQQLSAAAGRNNRPI